MQLLRVQSVFTLSITLPESLPALFERIGRKCGLFYSKRYLNEHRDYFVFISIV